MTFWYFLAAFIDIQCPTHYASQLETEESLHAHRFLATAKSTDSHLQASCTQAQGEKAIGSCEMEFQIRNGLDINND